MSIASNQIYAAFNAARGARDAFQMLELILKAAASQRHSLKFTAEDFERALSNAQLDAAKGPIKSAATALLDEAPSDRLNLIDDILTKSSSRAGDDLWIHRGAAEQLVAFVEGGGAARFSFPAAIHPALRLAVDQSRPARVSFVSMDPDAGRFARLCAEVLDVQLEVFETHPFARTDGFSADFELALPPFGLELRDPDLAPRATLDRLGGAKRLQHEAMAIADILEMAPDAKALIGVSGGALFREVGAESAARDELISSGRLEAVFAVPSGLIHRNTGISTGLICMGPAQADRRAVRFIDLADERYAMKGPRGRFEVRPDTSWREAMQGPEIDGVSTFIDVERIQSQGRILTPERYLQVQAGEAIEAFLEGQDHAPLSQIAEIIRPTFLPKSEEGDVEIFDVAPRDIGEDRRVALSSRAVLIERSALRNARNQRVLPGDVLLCTKGSVGEVGIVPEGPPRDGDEGFWTASQSLMILRVKGRKLLPEVLLEYLSSDAVQQHLKAISGGSTIPSINARELKALPIPIPPEPEQESIRQGFLDRLAEFDQIREIRERIAARRAASWPNNRIALSQTH